MPSSTPNTSAPDTSPPTTEENANNLELNASQQMITEEAQTFDPITYKELSPSTASAERSPGLSYAEVAARPPSPTGAYIRYSPAKDSPALLQPTQDANIDEDVVIEQVPARNRPVIEAGWSVVANKKKYSRIKSRRDPIGTYPLSPNARSDIAQPSDDSIIDPRKRRRLADDNGSEGLSPVENRKQNVLPMEAVARDVFSTPTRATSSKHVRERETKGALDIDVAMASDNKPFSSLMHLPHDYASTASSSQRRSSNPVPRWIHAESDDEDVSQILHDLVPLFPLPPSSIPSGTPQTPLRKNHRSSASKKASPTLRSHWSDLSEDEDIPDVAPPQPSKDQTPPEIEMSNESQPDSPPSSSKRRRRNNRSHDRRRRSPKAAGKARAHARIESSSSDGSEESVLPFDVENLDQDVVIASLELCQRVQGDSSNFRSKGMAPEQIYAWDNIDVTEPTLAIQILNHGTEEPGTGQRISLMNHNFAHFLRILTIAIVPGYSLIGFHGMNTEPFWYLGRGLSISVIIALVKLRYLNTSSLTMYFDFWHDTNPHLCAAFRLIHRFGAQTKAEYDELVRREILNSETLYGEVFDILTRDIDRDGMWRGYSRIDALTEILDSVDVNVVQYRTAANTTESVAVFHIKPPTADRRDWTRFCNILRVHGFGSNATGHPEPYQVDRLAPESTPTTADADASAAAADAAPATTRPAQRPRTRKR
ncbi:hypothetical protein EVJ58_g9220 [Rhodofomes roseus]|uniref:Uncharacterized protein n=1 Tax=Rhodofomes roseus TaxID=34475 RepID=A0A4Y9XVN2_9APHY|nr:hypothetical protein EVJ58_g9220 [Rhodofomes roseus]